MVGAAGIVSSVVFMAAPATAASSDLPEDAALPVPSFTSGQAVFAKPNSSAFNFGGDVGQTDGHQSRVVVVATDASSKTFDVATGVSGLTGTRWDSSTANAPTDEGRYTTAAYSVTSTTRSASSTESGVLWVDGTAPTEPTFSDPDGYTSDNLRYEPTVNFDPLPADQVADQTAVIGTTISYTITGPGGFTETRLYDDKRNTGSYSISRALAGDWAAGDYTLTAAATDLAGNTSPAGVTRFTIDPSAAVTPVAITSPADGATTGASPAIAGDGEDGATVTLTDTDGTALGESAVSNGTWTITPTIPLTAGSHTLTATQDVDGSTATRTITVDIPAVTPTPTPGNGNGNGNVASDGDANGAGGSPASPTRDELAFTGAELLPASIAAAVLITIGLAMIVRRRRLSVH